MSQADKASFRDSIPDSHKPTFTLLQQLIETLREVMTDAVKRKRADQARS